MSWPTYQVKVEVTERQKICRNKDCRHILVASRYDKVQHDISIGPWCPNPDCFYYRHLQEEWDNPWSFYD